MMDEWSVLLTRLPVAAVGAYISWRSAQGYLRRRRRRAGALPIDRAWQFLIPVVAVFVFVAIGIVLLVGAGVPKIIIDVLFVMFALSALGLLVGAAFVGWYSQYDALNPRHKEGGALDDT